jgi:hypothetical protein
MLMNSEVDPLLGGFKMMNSRIGLPILRGGPPLGTISMDQAVFITSYLPLSQRSVNLERPFWCLQLFQKMNENKST